MRQSKRVKSRIPNRMKNMLERLIKDATIVDGLGTPPRVGDLAIRNDRIAGIGQLNQNRREIF